MAEGRRRRGAASAVARATSIKSSTSGQRQLEAAVSAFVDHYNHRRYHESLGNLTPADVYSGRGAVILAARAKIKKLTIRSRRLSHHGRAA